jgi:hypothetical protein
VCILALAISACQKKNQATSVVSLTFPSAKSGASQKISTLSVDFSLVCYMANVTGAALIPTKKTSCDVPLGIRTQFQKPETEASLLIPRGNGYTVEIFAYSRASSSEPCPAIVTESLAGLDLKKIALVGKSTFDVQAAEVAVTVNVADPASNILSQYSMPALCSLNSGPGSGGPILVSSGGLRFYRAVDSSDGQKYTSTNGFGLVLGKDGTR